MAIPTIVSREMIPLAPGEPVEHSLGELTPENFYAAEGEKFKGADGEFFTLGEPIVANERLGESGGKEHCGRTKNSKQKKTRTI